MTRRLGVALASAVVVTALASAAGWLTGGPAQAAAFPGAFSTSAAADGLRQSMIVPGAPLTTSVVDVGAPSVQASLDSLGSSRAFASLPYPGETLATSSGLARTLSGLPVPDYPFYVHSSHPIVPQQEVATGPYRIRAESSEAASKATATGGPAVPDTAAVGFVRTDASTAATGSVTAEAESDVEAFTVGPLRLGQVLSRATVTLDGNGRRSSRADTHLVGAKVGDTAVTVSATGLTLAGTNQPLPALDAARAALTAAGITVELMPAEEHPTGVVAPTVRVTQRQPSGAQLISLLGGASAFVDGVPAAIPASGGPAAPPEVGPVPSSAGAAAPGATLTGSAEPARPTGSENLAAERLAAARAAATGSTPNAAPATPPAPDVPAPTAAAEGATPPVGGSAPNGEAAQRLASQLLGLSADAGPLYAALAVGGLVGLLMVGAALVRRGVAR